ncbi:MAG: threonine/serine dehydratase [Rhodospirillales bacterium]|nr:threonine/serine dehydratase [Rhodospirillales bacterium]MBO6786661.1 threonine/serine dehydratase [Rhodospirillales bacterium]
MDSLNSSEPPVFADIKDAARQLSGWARRTPLLENTILNDELGFRLIVKPECLQRTGSFKFRGAFNKISRIPEDMRSKGVVAFSSGNHAQGVAAAATLMGMKSTIIMPKDAPRAKIENTKALGGDVVLFDRQTESREEIGERLQKEQGAILVKPYDEPLIIAGQGTIGLEISEQVGEIDAKPDAVIVPAGGGGLVSGTALAISETLACPVYSAEPDSFDDHKRSLEAGSRQPVPNGASSICDALLAPIPGELTFSLNSRLLTGGLSVSDDEALMAMKRAMLSLKIVVEPGGAVALAAALTQKIDLKGKTVVVVCSGGNADPEMLARALAM